MLVATAGNKCSVVTRHKKMLALLSCLRGVATSSTRCYCRTRNRNFTAVGGGDVGSNSSMPLLCRCHSSPSFAHLALGRSFAHQHATTRVALLTTTNSTNQSSNNDTNSNNNTTTAKNNNDDSITSAEDDPRHDLISNLDKIVSSSSSSQHKNPNVPPLMKFERPVRAVFVRNADATTSAVQKQRPLPPRSITRRAPTAGPLAATNRQNTAIDVEAAATTSDTKPEASELSAELRDTLDWFREMPKGQKEELSQVVPSRLQISGRVANFNQDLKSFVDVCVKTDLMDRAQSAVLFYCGVLPTGDAGVHHRQAKTHKIRDVTTVSQLILAWSRRRGQTSKIYDLLTALDRACLKPNAQSYCGLLLSLVRHTDQQTNPVDVLAIKSAIRSLEKAGFSLNDIFSCVTSPDERTMLIKAVCSVVLDYRPPPVPSIYGNGVNTTYEQQIVSKLNVVPPVTNGSTKPMTFKNPAAALFADASLDLDFKNKLARQMAIERQSSVSIPAVVDIQEATRGPSSTKPPLDPEATKEAREKLTSLKASWSQDIIRAFERDLSALEAKTRGDWSISLVPYLRTLPYEQMAQIIVDEISRLLTLSDAYSPTLTMLSARLGRAVYRRFIIESSQRSGDAARFQAAYEEYLTSVSQPDLMASNLRDLWVNIAQRHGITPMLTERPVVWPYSICKAVGKFLYSIILNDVKVEATRPLNHLSSIVQRQIGDFGGERRLPVVYLIYRSYGSLNMQEVKVLPSVRKLQEMSDDQTVLLSPDDLPSLVPPVPWTSPYRGANSLSTLPLVRLPEQASHQRNLIEQTPPRQLLPVLDSLNAVSFVPFRVNQRILDIVIEVFRNGGDPKLDIPQPEWKLPQIPRVSNDLPVAEKNKLIKERMRIRKLRSESYSLWCYALYKLSVADEFRDNIFWFPNNLDFRGRVYPTPPHLSQLGDDCSRSLLHFAVGKPLGARGLDWLKIHLINLTGLKKKGSLNDRLNFANSLLPEILDSAERPLTGRHWWQQSEDPWQTLACCFEIADVIRSPDPENYISHFPIHQDGSCNVLQHYAALGRDQAGAESVNLCVSVKPRDVYSDVVDKVEQERARDASNGNEVALFLDGCVKRKVIKQTVMTTVYGVTRYGAKMQILRQLRENPSLTSDQAWRASTYLRDKTFEVLRQMFKSTREIQDWFTVAAHLISQICRKPVQWVTPLGLPVVQPYHNAHVEFRNGITYRTVNDLYHLPNSMKQRNAFPPNFIHSLDSTHMMLTALNCFRAGITFASVHDSYWTHPADVDIMNRICREQFVNLHSEPILENLSEHLLTTFGYPEVPPLLPGAFDEEVVLPSGQPQPSAPGAKASAKAAEVVRAKQLLNDVLTRVPPRGTYKLESVHDSIYFFS